MTTASPKTDQAAGRGDTGPDAGGQTGAPDAGRQDRADGTDRTAEELESLARARDEATQRAQEIVAGRVLCESRTGDEREHAMQLVVAARRDLLTELRAHEQEQARQELARAARSSEDAVAGAVAGMTALVRSLVPAVLVRPQDFIEASYSLADQGLRVARTVALTLAGSGRALSA